MKKSDRELINQLQEGDSKAFNELFYRYRKTMLNCCVALLKDVDEAENIVQESFIKIWEIRDRLDPDKGLASYLFTIIRNKSYDYFKRQEKEFALQAHLKNFAWDVSLMPAFLEEPISVSLDTMLQSLSPKRKKIISLIIEHGKSHKEIAKEMDISISTVKNQMVKAKKHLQNSIDPNTLYSSF